jgi:putative membrane protein
MRRALVAAVTSIVALSAAASALAETAPDRNAMWHMGWGWGWGGMIFGPLVMLVFLAGVVVLAVLLVRWLGGGGGHGHEGPPARRTALEILQERFAKGEIDKQEYEERKRVLKGDG